MSTHSRGVEKSEFMELYIQHQISKEVARSVLHVGKGAKFGVKKVNDGRVICSRACSFGNGKHYQKHTQHSKC